MCPPASRGYDFVFEEGSRVAVGSRASIDCIGVGCFRSDRSSLKKIEGLLGGGLFIDSRRARRDVSSYIFIFSGDAEVSA